jgi:hypothetical protein
MCAQVADHVAAPAQDAQGELGVVGRRELRADPADGSQAQRPVRAGERGAGLREYEGDERVAVEQQGLARALQSPARRVVGMTQQRRHQSERDIARDRLE